MSVTIDTTEVKIVLLGEVAVGKSCIVSRYVVNKFDTKVAYLRYYDINF